MRCVLNQLLEQYISNIGQCLSGPLAVVVEDHYLVITLLAKSSVLVALVVSICLSACNSTQIDVNTIALSKI